MENLDVIYAVGETGLYEDVDNFPMSVAVIKMADRTRQNGDIMDKLFDYIDTGFVRGQCQTTLAGVYSGKFDGEKFTDSYIISRF